MKTTLSSSLIVLSIAIAGLFFALAIPALTHAQSTTPSSSEVTGTLTAGSGSSVTGTVATSSGGGLSGTVVSPTSTGNNGGSSSGSIPHNGSSGGSSGGGTSGGTSDVCPNIAGVQTILPGGFMVVSGNCVATTGTTNVGGETANNLPGVPNTGEGGNWALALLSLGLSLFAAVGGVTYMLLTRDQRLA